MVIITFDEKNYNFFKIVISAICIVKDWNNPPLHVVEAEVFS